jgi:xanthine dehydrogenase accessory factor
MSDRDEDILECMRHLKDDDEPFALATVLRTEDATSVKAGAKAVVRADGSLVGWLGSGCAASAVRKAAAEALADGKPRLIRVRPDERAEEDARHPGMEAHTNHCPSGGTIELFIEPMMPRPEVVVLGASPVARALCTLARDLGFVVTVAADAADRESFGQVDRFIEGFALDDHPWRLEAQIIVATQGKRDREALRAALMAPAPSSRVSLVASRRKAAVLRARLAAEGVPEEALAKLRAPAGLDIGARTPPEIALSILAAIVRDRNGASRPSRDAEQSGDGKEGRAAGRKKETAQALN